MFSPLSIKGFSAVRNEANPDVDLYAIEETGFVFQSGYEVFNDFYAGIQLKAWNRKFIKQRFKLVALGTQAGQDLLKPKTQSVTYVEPGFTYFLSQNWKPRISLMVVNLGVVSKKYEDFEEPVEAQVGLGISPPVLWGEIDSNGISGGVYYDVNMINAGIVYSTTQFANQSNNFYTQTVYLQLGWQL